MTKDQEWESREYQSCTSCPESILSVRCHRMVKWNGFGELYVGFDSGEVAGNEDLHSASRVVGMQTCLEIILESKSASL